MEYPHLTNDAGKQLVTCDYCNPDGDPENSEPLPAGLQEALRFTENETWILRGICWGTWEDALKDGWEDREDGQCCPVCAVEQNYLASAGDPETLTVAGALKMLTGSET